MIWNSSNLKNPRTYNYGYDDLNRLDTAIYSGNAGENYTEGCVYDNNGNITHLERLGHIGGTGYAKIDVLDCTYNGNQLIKVNDMVADQVSRDFGFKDCGVVS